MKTVEARVREHLLMRRVREHEARGTAIYYVPPDAYIKGHGYRASIVVAGEDGFHWTGTWPYHGKPGEVLPYFWGPSLEAAQGQARRLNERVGVTEEQANLIILRSMSRGTRGRRKS